MQDFLAKYFHEPITQSEQISLLYYSLWSKARERIPGFTSFYSIRPVRQEPDLPYCSFFPSGGRFLNTARKQEP